MTAFNPAAGQTAATGITTKVSNSNGVLTITDALNRVTRTTRNSTSVRIKRPSSSTDNIIMTLDGSGRVTQVNRDGMIWNYSYSVAGNVLTTTISHAAGTRVVEAYTNLSALKSERDETGRTVVYEYDGFGRLAKVTMPDDNYTQYAYDARGNQTSTVAYAKGGGGTIATSATYPATCGNALTCNKPEATTDARGAVTRYGYDPTHGGVTTVTRPAAPNGVSPQTRYTYMNTNGVHQLGTVSACRTAASCSGGADEVRTTIGYSGGNYLPTSVTIGAGDGSLTATTTATYDAYGNVRTIDGPLPGAEDTTRFYYDAAQQLKGVVGPDPDGGGGLSRRATRYGYNADGQVTSVEQGTAGDQSDAAINGIGILQTVTTSYDAAGRKITEALNAGGATHAYTQYSYDAIGRLDCAAQRMNPSAFGSQSDACSGGLSGAYGVDRIIRTGYDAAGRVTSVTSGLGTAEIRTESTSYTLNGQTHTVSDGKSNTTTYSYDAFDRLSRTTYPNPAGGDYEELGYDANGNVTSRRLRDGQVVGYSYDALNRMTLMDLSGNGIDLDISYGYDLFGRVMTSINGSGHLTHYGYDALGRLATEHTTYGGVKTSAYDLAGRRTRLTWPDGNYVTYEYDQTGAMTIIRENGGFALAWMGYDNLGRRTYLARGNNTITNYGYDTASRLNALTQDLAGTAHDLSISFGHNPAGQITSRTASNDAYSWTGHYNVNRNYVTNGLNQYTQSGTTPLSYDRRGNLAASGGRSWSYSQRNQLFYTPGATLYYDPPNRLDLVYDGSANTTFDYDGDRLATEGTYIVGGINRRYVHGPGADEPLVWYEGAGMGDRRWLHTDERGSVVAVTNLAGSALAINTYDEYGIPGVNNLGRFQYTGQAWIPQLGLYYYKARMYSPTLGRFMQTDPIGYGDGLNWYGYVGGDPVNGRDPTGMACDSVVCVTAPRDGGGGFGFGFLPFFGGFGGVLAAPEIIIDPETGEEVVVNGRRPRRPRLVAPPTPMPVAGERQPPQSTERPNYCNSVSHKRGTAFEDFGGWLGVGGAVAVGVGAAVSAPAIATVGVGALALGGAVSLLGNAEQALAGDQSSVVRGALNAVSGGVISKIAKSEAAESILEAINGEVIGKVIDDGC